MTNASTAPLPLKDLLNEEYQNLVLSNQGPALLVTINRPERLNALNSAVLAELNDLLLKVGRVARREIAGVVLTGAGERAFVAGADISLMQGMSPSEAERFAALGQRVSDLMETLDRPVIAAVAGYALGGGCELAMGCDMIYASENAVFGQPEVTLGLIPSFGGCTRLPRLIGPGRARELAYTARSINAQQALEWGLVTRLFPDREQLIAGALETIEVISTRGPAAVALTKQTINATLAGSTAVGLAAERAAFAAVMATDDAIEGTTAFLAKRPPNFQDH